MRRATIDTVHFVHDEWQKLSAALRYFSLTSLTLGCLMIGIGAVLDVQGAWEDLPFLTSIYSAFSSAAFGLPLALIVISRLAAHQAKQEAEQTARDQAKRKLDQSTRQLLTAVGAILKSPYDPRYDRWSEVRDLISCTAEAEHRLIELLDSSNCAARENRHYFQLRIQLMRELGTRMKSLDPDHLRVWWSGVQFRWQYIAEVLRPQFYELGYHWPIDASEMVELSDALSAQPSIESLRGIRDERISSPEDPPNPEITGPILEETRLHRPATEAAKEFETIHDLHRKLDQLHRRSVRATTHQRHRPSNGHVEPLARSEDLPMPISGGPDSRGVTS